MIPLATLTNHLAILGKTGSGKTSTEKLAVEQVVDAGFRVCVLDAVKSDWWGIASSADGRQPGLPFQILGGPHGHVPLSATAGEVVGRLVGAGDLPLSIIDMADFEAGGLQRFFVDFAPALMRHMKGVLYLVIEEAHEFAPKERAGFGAETQAIHWAKKLATAGRSRGIRLVVATQRVQALHNAVLGSCETMIVHRLTAPADQKPVLDWLKANTDTATAKDVAESLSSLATGTGWVCSGEARVFEKTAFPKFRTYDNHATPTGDDEERVVPAVAAVNVEALREMLGAPVEAEVTAKVAPVRRASEAELAQAEKRGYERGYTAGMATAFARARSALDALRIDEPPMSAEPPPARVAPAPTAARPKNPETAPHRSPAANISGAGGLVAAAASVHPVGLTWAQVATIAGRKPAGGHFNSSRKTALTEGWLEESGGLVRATAAGLKEVGAEAADGDPLDVFAAVLPQPANKMFAFIREHPGVTVIGLASALQMQPRGGHWNSGIATLKRNGLLEINGNGLHIAELRA